MAVKNSYRSLKFCQSIW